MSNLWPFIYTRISHDLSGLAGSVFNGTELLAEDTSPDVVELLQTAAGQLMARLQFFRQIFGIPNKLNDDKTAAYLSTLSVPVQLDGRCADALDGVLCMALTDALPKGGCIHVNEQVISVENTPIREGWDLKGMLEKGEGEPTPQTAVALYAHELAQQQNTRLAVNITGTSVYIQKKR